MTPLSHYLIFSGILFAIGLSGANVALAGFSRARGLEGVPVYDAQVLALFIMAIAAAEVAVGLALIVAMFRARRGVESTSLNTLKD